MARKAVQNKLLTVSAGPFKISRKSTTSMSHAELQAQIDRVRAFAMANVGTLTGQVEALKRSLPAELPTVLAGPIKRPR